MSRKSLGGYWWLLPCLALGLLIGYGVTHPKEPIGILGIGIGLIWLLSLILTYVGRRQPHGRRYGIGLGFYQPLDHPWEEIPRGESEKEWAPFGISEARLSRAWRCRNCTMKRFLVISADGDKGLLTTGFPATMWGKWAAGFMLAFSKDPPTELLEEASVRNPPDQKSDV